VTRTSIATPEPFDAAWTLGFLRARQAPAIETIEADGLIRAIRIEGRAARLRVSLGERRITAECDADVPPAALRGMVRRMFDLDADLEAFAAHVGRDRVLGPLVRTRPGLRVPQFLDPFECVIRAILGQQVSVRAATTLVNRLAIASSSGGDRAGDRADPYVVMPSAEDLAAAGPERLRRIGLTRTRRVTLHRVAEAVAEKRVDLEMLRAAPGDEAQAALDALPGIGPWTASYIRMRGLGDRDAFPAADLGVLKALGATPSEAERRSRRWSPWRAYAVMHLWAG
jgi:3-methyladenine DNA glycosylase/8-oxoguanine DNA glycosylase